MSVNQMIKTVPSIKKEEAKRVEAPVAEAGISKKPEKAAVVIAAQSLEQVNSPIYSLYLSSVFKVPFTPPLDAAL